MAKFKIGDDVTIVKYGNLFWSMGEGHINILSNYPLYKKGDKVNWYDIAPEEVGKRGVVKAITNTNNRQKYSLEKIGMSAWFEEEQLIKTPIWQKNKLLRKLIRILTTLKN